MLNKTSDIYQINMSECSIDAMFVPAKKSGKCVGKTKCGKGTELVAITEKRGRPVSVLITSASRLKGIETYLYPTVKCWVSGSIFIESNSSLTITNVVPNLRYSVM